MGEDGQIRGDPKLMKALGDGRYHAKFDEEQRSARMQVNLLPWMERAAEAPVFREVAQQDLLHFLSVGVQTRIQNGHTIFVRGDPATAVYLILGGSVRISTLAASGKCIVVEIFQCGELFGEIGAIDDGTRTADATAMGPVDLLTIPSSAFRDLLATSVAFANKLLRIVLNRLRRTYSLLEDASLRSVEQRLAKQVLYLVRLGASGETKVRLQSRMHQDDLADLLGVTSRSIINVLNKWRAEGLASFDGRSAQLTILDMQRFRHLLEE